MAETDSAICLMENASGSDNTQEQITNKDECSRTSRIQNYSLSLKKPWQWP